VNISEMNIISMKSTDGLKKMGHEKGMLSTDDILFVRSDDTTQENFGALGETARTNFREKSWKFD
jgi:hypothetical protein